MTNSLITTSCRKDSAQRFVNDFANNNYYLFAGSHIPFAANVIPLPRDDVYNSSVDLYQSMIFGKKITSNDVSLMIQNYPYVSNTVYAKYNDADPLLFSKQFYVIVYEGSNYNVYKVLDNNSNAPSTIQPSFSFVDSNNSDFLTADGYRWKYMFTAVGPTAQQFSTTSYFPIVANTQVSQNAIKGSLDVIEVLSSGNGYSNYLSGVFSATDVQLNGNSVLYSVNSYGSLIDNFYSNCLIYITSDPLGNSAGQYANIVAYTVNSTSKWIQLDKPFVKTPLNGATYQIYPSVVITGDGNQTVNAIAWAVVNNQTNSISSVELIQKGKGYSYISASVASSNVVGIGSPAQVRAIYPPPGGHGYDVYSELGATSVSVATSFIGTEANTLFSNVHYQKAGILKNPIYQTATLQLANQVGIFVLNETVYDVTKTLIATGANASASANTLTVPSINLQNQVLSNSNVIISNGLEYQFQNVTFVTNSSQLQLSSNCAFTSPNTSLYLVNNVVSTGTVSAIAANQISLSLLNKPLSANDFIIGKSSGAIATVNSISISGKLKSFDTFIATQQYVGTIGSGTFTQDEVLAQVNSNAVGYLAGISSDNTTIYVSNQVGIFSNSNPIVGQTSGATFNFTSKYLPEIVYESAEVLYIENFSSIDRTQLTSENFNIILQF